MINCKGETGYFRVKMVDKNLKSTVFNDEKINTLKGLVKRLENWEAGTRGEEKLDSYYQINFKINNGKVKAIF